MQHVWKDALVLLFLLGYSLLVCHVMQSGSTHQTLTRAASAVHATSSELAGSVSKHVLPCTIAFSGLNTLHEAAKGIETKSTNDFVASVNNQLLFTYSSSYEKVVNGRKRKSDMSVEDEVETVLKPLGSKVDIKQKDDTKLVLVYLLRDLKGPNNERLVQSVVVAHQKLRPSDAEPRVIIAARLVSGVPIPLGKLKAALRECWADGALTIEHDSSLLSSFDLPLSEEGRLSAEIGHEPLRLVTALPRPPVVAAAT